MSMGTIAKDESDIALYSVNWAPRLADGETLVTSAWTIGTGLTYEADSIAASLVKTTVKLSGGTQGVSYSCINTVTTSTGQTLSRTGTIAVRAL